MTMTPIPGQGHAFSPLGRGIFTAGCPCREFLKNGLTIRVIKISLGWADVKNVEPSEPEPQWRWSWWLPVLVILVAAACGVLAVFLIAWAASSNWAWA
jgi:hypothetical protein